MVVCHELEGEGASSGSSVASRLRSLGGRVAERIWSAFRLRVQRSLGVASTHYDMDLERVSLGYVVAPGVKGDAARDAMEEGDAAVEGYVAVLSRKIGMTSSLMSKTMLLKVRREEEETCESLGPWSPCK